MNWSGAAFDPDQDLLVLPSSNLAAVVRLIARSSFDNERSKNRDLGGDWEFAPQRGTPYGMARRFCRAPAPPPVRSSAVGTAHRNQGGDGRDRLADSVRADCGTEKLPQANGWGSPSLGGPITTAGGITFVAGTLEAAIRAFETATGKELWRGSLPTSA